MWYGIPGSGSHYWTARYGQYFVGGGIHQKYAQQNYECGPLGPPVKAYGWLSEFGAAGQWFVGGAIFYRDGAWRMVLGNYGQTAGRLTEVETQPPDDAEVPPDPPEAVAAPDQEPPVDVAGG